MAFDPLICASVHNKIISFLAGHADTYNNRVVHNFFDAYGDDAAAIRDRLSGPLIAFLENIDVLVSNDPESAPVMNFAPHLAMPNPRDFWAFYPGCENCVVLYLATEEGHGFCFDMTTTLCSWMREVVPLKHGWYHLQTALNVWLRLYEAGKFQPSVGREAIYNNANYRRYIAAIDLSRDLEAYHGLLRAIQARSPAGSITISEEPGLVDRETLNRFHISGFLRDFLLNARRPSFTYIAPGVQIPSPTWLGEMLELDRGSPRYHLVRQDDKVFKGETNANASGWQPDWMQQESSSNCAGEPLPLFPGPKLRSASRVFERENAMFLVNGVTGLYSWPDVIAEDAVRFVLPDPVGLRGWVAYGNPEALTVTMAPGYKNNNNNNDSLYQHGWCPFLPNHLPNLSMVLDAWRRLVERGVWSVGPDGVEDGVEVFGDADSSEYEPVYRFGMCHLIPRARR